MNHLPADIGDPWRVDPDLRTRWATPENPTGRPGVGGRSHGGRKGSAAFFIRAGDTLTLADEAGEPGTIRRIWMTASDLRPTMLRSLRLRIYWDGETEPAVDAPIGDFFGAVLGRITRFESALFASPEGRSFCCFAPMPFRDGMRVTLANEGPDTLYQFYYEIDYTIGDRHGESPLYFHSRYRCENPTRLGEDFLILPEIRGHGRFLGAFVGVAADTRSYGRSWWGEGECKVWIDDDEEFPTLCGTGTEDWIGTGWELERSHWGATQGCHLVDADRFRYGFYRFHLADPVCFTRRIRVEMQQIGSWKPYSIEAMRASGKRIVHAGPGSRNGESGTVREVDLDRIARTQPYGLFEREDLWACCAFFCLDRPAAVLPPIDPGAKRIADIPDREEFDVHESRMVPKEITALKRFIAEVDSLTVEEFEEIRDCAATIAEAIRNQERILDDAGRRE